MMNKHAFRILMFTLLTANWFFSACSPVQFDQQPTEPVNECPEDNPCVQPEGVLRASVIKRFATTNKVDILVVVDNSGSMATEQFNLSTPFNHFISNLNNAKTPDNVFLDWQIGVTNTDVCGTGKRCPGPQGLEGGRGRFLNRAGQNPMYGNFLIKRGDSNPVQKFADTVQRGNEVGSGDERAIKAAIMALDANPSFFRDQSNLAIVILSDEDERSVGGRDTSDIDYIALESEDQPEALVSRVNSRWSNKNLKVNSIIVKPGDSSCLAAQRVQPPYGTAHYGYKYKDLSVLTGGYIGSICDNGNGSFANMLSNITDSIANQAASKVVVLSQTPVEEPTVTFNPPSNQQPWSWNGGNKITFTNQRPVNGTTVTVTYDYIP